MSAHPIAQQMQNLMAELNQRFLERKDEIHALAVAVLAGHHISLVGAPGVAKTDLIRTFVHQITGKRYFEQQLSKTRPAEAVFGPLNIKEFRENGSYLLKRAGFATDAEFVMFDEAWKMSPVLGHDMLALLNERLYHEVNGGNSVHSAPLSSAFLPSNELPTEDAEDAAAIWDRVLLRLIVDDIQDDANFATLLTSSMDDPTVEIAWEDLKQVIDEVVPNVTVPDSVVEQLVSLRNGLKREQINPSSRRFRQSMKLLKANAFLNGRDSVSSADIEVLQWALWETPQQIEKVQRLCLSAANPWHEPVLKIKESIAELNTGMDERSGEAMELKADYAKEVKKKLLMARDSLQTLQMQAGEKGDDLPKVDEIESALKRTLKRVFVELFEMEESVAEEGVATVWNTK